MKPRLFIGSSTEALKTAYAIQENLEHDVLCKVWTQGIFQLSRNTLDDLLDAVHAYDFAVFLFQPDDISQIRDVTARTVRDNVIFEIGMFIAVLGKERVFFLVPKGSEKIHLPTDLIGIEPGHYTPPERDEDLLAAIGPFCNRVRRQIEKVSREAPKREVGGVTDSSVAGDQRPVERDEKPTVDDKPKNVEAGVQVDASGNHTITIEPTVFFDNRICSAFPGIRGLDWFTDGKQALDRLQILLKEPLAFEKASGHSSTREPIWWWRSGSCAPISFLRRLSDTRCLMDIQELEISRIAVYRSDAYYRSFVYVEVSPDQPTGLYPSDEATINNRIELLGYASEEYGLFQNIPITRACYDDASAVIDGVVMDISGAELRVRYLSRYNFLIASQSSPINSPDFDRLSETLLDDMVLEIDRLEELCAIVERLPRRYLGEGRHTNN